MIATKRQLKAVEVMCTQRTELATREILNHVKALQDKVVALESQVATLLSVSKLHNDILLNEKVHVCIDDESEKSTVDAKTE